MVIAISILYGNRISFSLHLILPAITYIDESLGPPLGPISRFATDTYLFLHLHSRLFCVRTALRFSSNSKERCIEPFESLMT